MNPFRLACFALLLLGAFVRSDAADQPIRRELLVDGVAREALLYIPATARTKPTPVIFAFHGHGGSMANAARSFHFQTEWPEALVVYPQGLNTPGQLTDLEGQKSGWQRTPGDQADRDLKFFDAILTALQSQFQIDEKRLYATGHSNGGAFTYLLWATRGRLFAAFGPSAAAAPKLLDQLMAKPLIHIAGQNDPLVKFAWQEHTVVAVRQINECGEGQTVAQYCTLYASKLGAPVVTYIHPGTHQFPAEAPAAIVKFFQQQTIAPAP